jgi:hypothetical protein
MFGGHSQDHASHFIQQVPAKIHQECQRWVHGPLEICPCECRGPVQVLVCQIVEGKMGHSGAPKDQNNNQQMTPMVLGSGIHCPGWVHKVCGSVQHLLP